MIEFKNIYKSYKDKSVLVNINLTIETGEFFVLVGASGCGKTTLLKTINKINQVDKGEVVINGVSLKNIKSTDLPRKIGYVVQEGGLFSHLTIAENIGLVLKIAKENKENINERIDKMLEMVNLNPNVYRELYPSQLSGGQRQRVGVARAFASDPEIILMDEPFSALDPVTRNELQDEIFRLQKTYNKTVVFVTHDMDEAIKLATRICIIQNGHIVQCDSPENILKHPANSYIDTFIGKNRLWNNPEFVQAQDIMMAKPYSISKERTVVQAIQIMSHNNIDSLLVTDKGKLLGMVWLKDLKLIEYTKDSIEEYVYEDYISVYEDTTLKQILTTINYNVSGIIPVIDHCNRIKGYLTKGRLLATLSRQFNDKELEEERGVLIG